MKDEDKTYLWMIQHHIEALVTLLDMNKQHEILNNNVAYDFISYMASQSETVWEEGVWDCLLYTSPSPRDRQKSRMPSSA